MKKLLPMVLLLVPLALAACGEEGDGDAADCKTEVVQSLSGKEYCLPPKSETKAICIQDPVTDHGRGQACEYLVPHCDGVIALDIWAEGGEYYAACECMSAADADRYCTGKIYDL